MYIVSLDVQNYSKCLGFLKIKKKKKDKKHFTKFSKCAINVCVVVLPLGVKITKKYGYSNDVQLADCTL